MSTFPSHPGFRALNFRASDPTLHDEAHSGREQVRKFGPHRWAFTARFVNMSRASMAPIAAFIASLRGRYTPFDITIPLYSDPQGSAGGTPLVKGAGQTGGSLLIDGCTFTTTDWLKAGDFFRLGGHNKTYRLIADADTNGLGETTLQFVPNLIQSPADNEALTVVAVPFQMRLASDVHEIPTKEADRFSFEIDMRESY